MSEPIIKTAKEMRRITDQYRRTEFLQSAIAEIEKRAQKGYDSIFFSKHDFNDRCKEIVLQLKEYGYVHKYDYDKAGWIVYW